MSAEVLTPKALGEVVERLARARDDLLARSIESLVMTLGSVGERFTDPEDDLRREALGRVAESASFSPEMTREVVDGMAADWSRSRLDQLVRSEFGDPTCLDGFTSVGDRVVRALGGRLCVQIVSGSVPGVGVTALIRSLLVKSPALLKVGRGDEVLPELFARGLREVDPRLAEALAVVYWAGGSTELERAALSEADLVVVYGSDETVEQLRTLSPVTARFVGYHHRVSVAVVGRDALRASVAQAAAEDLARAVALFEGRGCVCPQVTYVEEGGEVSPTDFAHLVAAALGDLEKALPSLALDTDEAGRLQQVRAESEMNAASGRGEIIHGASVGWTVLFDDHGGAQSGPGRFARIRSLADLGSLDAELSPIGAHLQSVGVVGMGDRKDAAVERLAQAGATRVVPIRELSFPPAWWLHDGRGPLRDLVRWVELERE